MTTQDILIVGATGQQGRATIAALYRSMPHDSPVRILALTRSVASPKSQSLQRNYPDIVLVEGVTREPSSFFVAYPNISAIFLVTVPSDEEAQTIPLIDSAVAPTNKVNHVVFSSVDRGGDQASWHSPTSVPHFAAKHRIELHLRDACVRTGKQWTILRPTGFMDNYNPGFFGSMMASLWTAGLPSDRKMQLISTDDIGLFAAKALLNPEKWAGKAVGLVSDELTYLELQEIFKRVIGKDLPEAHWLFAKGVMWSIKEARTSFEWFHTVGYKASLDYCRYEEPNLLTWEMWLEQSSGWKSAI